MAAKKKAKVTRKKKVKATARRRAGKKAPRASKRGGRGRTSGT